VIEDLGIKQNCIFRKGKAKMDVGPRAFSIAKRERALTEATIATLKTLRYGFNKPRAKSAEWCTTMGHLAFLGMNTSKILRDWAAMKSVVAV